MNIRIGIIIAAMALFLGGCASAPQQPVSLNHESINAQAGRIGVAMTTLPKIDTHLPGADCLLSMAAASIANSSLTTYTKTLSYEDLPKLKIEIAEMLRKKGADVTVIEEDLNIKDLKDFSSKEPNFASKDFSPLRKKYNIDKLLVVDITALGFIRTYSAYVPTSDPKGQLQGAGYIVNLKNNAYDWYLPVSVMKSADQNWDEPPKFPGLTNAYFQSLEIGKDSFLKPFAEKIVGGTVNSSTLAAYEITAQKPVQ